jgi:hypothetical protein
VLLLAALGGLCLARELGCRELVALIGAAAWSLCDFMAFWLGWPMAMTVAILPLLLLAVRRTARTPGLRSAALLTTTLVLAVLGGHPESTLHVVVLGMIWGLAEVIATRGRQLARVLLAAAGSGVVALGLCAVYLLPFVDALPQTVQHAIRSRPGASVSRSVTWPEALERSRAVIVPYAYGVPGSSFIRGAGVGQLRSGYAGSVLLAPMLLGLLRGRWCSRGLRCLLAAMVLGGAWLYVSAPGLTDLVDSLPLLDLAISQRLAFAGGLAGAMLACLGLEAWAREPGQHRLGWWSAASLGLLAITIGLLWPGMEVSGLSPELLGARAAMELVPLALMAATLLLVRSIRIGLVCVLALLVSQRVVQVGGLNHAFDPALAHPRIVGLDAIPRSGEPWRVVGVGSAMLPSTSVYLGLEDPRGYEAMDHRLLRGTYALWSGTDRWHAHNARVDRLDRPFLSFLNVRYAIVSEPGPPAHAQGWRKISGGPGWSLLESPRALPRAFVPREVRLDLHPRVVRRQIPRARSYADVAWIEQAGTEAGTGRRQPATRANGPGWVITRWRGLDLELLAELEHPGWVVVSQTAWKGWHATSPGLGQLPLAVANHAFLALHLPEGTHHVDLAYRPRSFELGRAVTAATACLLLLLGLARWATRSRRAGRGVPRATPGAAGHR